MPITSSETSFNDRPQHWKFTKIEVFPMQPVKISMFLLDFDVIWSYQACQGSCLTVVG
jgi:hypothetical protein